jgi:hypothetical protein
MTQDKASVKKQEEGAKDQPATTSHNATVPGGASGERPAPGSAGQHAKGDEPIQKQNPTSSKV